ncbi:MAG TPA: DUF6036 family nucleotidyltransferase [Caulobacteraceae bacterium]|nr:DUF6036 family nucleotidyltransferase [Caulobacteraceae bacterium]
MMEVNKVDHILRAAGAATGQKLFVLIGSAAIFAWQTIVPAEMAMTREVDLFAYDVDAATAESIAFEIDGSLGQASQFDATYGYYCDGVGPDTAILPTDWQTRAKEYLSPGTEGVKAIVPHPDDIALAKLCAGREKDYSWLVAAIRGGMIEPSAMRERLDRLPADRTPDRQTLETRLDSVVRR